jgi:hypothetical protein
MWRAHTTLIYYINSTQTRPLQPEFGRRAPRSYYAQVTPATSQKQSSGMILPIIINSDINHSTILNSAKPCWRAFPRA